MGKSILWFKNHFQVRTVNNPEKWPIEEQQIRRNGVSTDLAQTVEKKINENYEEQNSCNNQILASNSQQDSQNQNSDISEINNINTSNEQSNPAAVKHEKEPISEECALKNERAIPKGEVHNIGNKTSELPKETHAKASNNASELEDWHEVIFYFKSILNESYHH